MTLQKQLTVFCAAMLLAAATLTAQQPKIDLRHAGTSTIFTDINAALTASVNGDTIYLPGGFFPGFTIDKGIAVIGVGHHPDSTVVTMRTQVNGDVNISHTADNCFLSGLYVQSSISIGNGQTGNVSGVRISRCRIVGNITAEGLNGLASDWVVNENVVGGVLSFDDGNLATNMVVANNILAGIKHMTFSTISNNIFFGFGHFCGLNWCYPSFINVTHCTVKNSVFGNPLVFTIYCYFYNNLNGGINVNDGDNAGSGNILNVDFNALFVQYTAPWDYTDDFHLTNPAYNTGGTDGTPIGIYGGMFPWKAGSVPFTPHINLKVIAPTTNAAGQLPITIRAKAQGN